jgi:hypothetical protein
MMMTIAAVAILPACAIEATVSYQGKVVELGNANAFEFSTDPASVIGTPISNATVALSVNDGNLVSTRTGSFGDYGPIAQTFQQNLGNDDDDFIQVIVVAPDGRTFSYNIDYEMTSDPTVAQPDCDSCSPNFLVFTLALAP